MKPFSRFDWATLIFGLCMMVFLAHQLAQPRAVVQRARAAAPEPGALHLPCLLEALEMRESSGRDLPPYLDCSKKHSHGRDCQAFGLFSFHRARWSECGGKDARWGKADRVEQECVMAEGIIRELSRCPSESIGDRLIWIANWHRLGHGELRENGYTRDIKALYFECCAESPQTPPH